MIVQFVGETDIDKMRDKLEQVVEDTLNKIEQEQGVDITGCSVTGAEVNFQVYIEGVDEPQMLTVDHHGSTEPFKWIVNADDGSEVNNEDNSVYDEWQASQMQGQEHDFKEIESKFPALMLTELLDETETHYNFTKKVYQHKDGYKVVRIYQDNKLIQEYSLLPKET